MTDPFWLQVIELCRKLMSDPDLWYAVQEEMSQ